MPDPEDLPRSSRELWWIALCHRLVLACVVIQLGIWIGYGVAISTGLARDNGEGAVLALIWTAGVGLLGARTADIRGEADFNPDEYDW
jgi:hypothetical protein